MTGAGAMALLCAAASALWVGLFRVPFGSPRVRRRIGLAVATATGIPAGYAFAAFGTVLYVGLGVAALAAVALLGDVPVATLLTRPVPWSVAPATVLAAAGAASLTALAMAVYYTLRPTVDVPGAVRDVQWIKSIMTMPTGVRWLMPVLGAVVEEAFFRGVVLTGLLRAGATLAAALAVSVVLFAAGQVAMTTTATQAVVLGVSSVVLGVVGALLVAAYGNVVPALLVHSSFAGFYTGTSWRR